MMKGRKMKGGQLLTAVLLFVCMILPGNRSFGQISSGGVPASFTQKELTSLPLIVLPALPSDITKESAGDGSLAKTLAFAWPFDVEYSMERDGRWDELPDGTAVWRIGFVSAGAYSLNIIFSAFRIPEGGRVFMYNPERTYLLGAFTALNNNEKGVLPVMPVPGERIIVEYDLPRGAPGKGMLVIGRISHDYKNSFFPSTAKDGSFGDSGPCNPDINCPPGDKWQLHRQAVCRLLINGVELCSGVMLNNTAEDGKPYLYTANHCIGSQGDAANTLVVFNYQSPYCNGPDVFPLQSLSGTTLRATSDRLDFTLVELNSRPPQSYQPYYAGWRRTENAISSTVCIHHPQGDVKKIAMDDQAPFTATYSDASDTYDHNAHWKVARWEIGTTEGGSSGCPLIDQNGYVIGTLTGGDAQCGRAINDYFAKTSRAWDDYASADQQLKAWLDPMSLNPLMFEGFNPYSDSALEADFLVSAGQVCSGAFMVFNDYSSGEVNSHTWLFGDEAIPPSASGPGPHYVKYTGGGTKAIRLIVTDAITSDTVDREINVTLNVPVTAGFSYTPDQNNWIRFTDESINAGKYYWDFGDNTAPAVQSNPEHRYTNTGDYIVRQRVSNMACMDTATLQITVSGINDPVLQTIRIYPLPADEVLMISFGLQADGDITVSLTGLSGTLVYQRVHNTGAALIEIPCSNLAPGLYVLKVQRGKEIFSGTIAIIHE